MKRNSFFIPIYLSIFLTISCAEKTNLLQYTVTQKQGESIDILISKAEHLYDKGEFDAAFEYAKKANELDKHNERAAIQLGFIYFALAGMDSFTLAKNLIEQGKSENESESADESPLAGFGNLLGLDPSEYTAITLDNNRKIFTDGREPIEGISKIELFKDLPVLLPKTAPLAREANTKAIYNLAKAVEVICPFASESVKILSTPSDPRHEPSNCPPTENARHLTAKTHFLWAIAHLAEAIAFNAVVLYDPTGNGANLIRRSDALKDRDKVKIGEYIQGVGELASVLDIVLPIDPEETKNSMLTAMFNDLEATSRAFQTLAGIPPEMTAKINQSIAKLKAEQEKIKSSEGEQGNTEAENNSKALKEQLTSKLSENVRSQITERYESGEIEPEDKTKVCTAYAQISSQPFDLCNQ